MKLVLFGSALSAVAMCVASLGAEVPEQAASTAAEQLVSLVDCQLTSQPVRLHTISGDCEDRREVGLRAGTALELSSSPTIRVEVSTRDGDQKVIVSIENP